MRKIPLHTKSYVVPIEEIETEGLTDEAKNKLLDEKARTQEFSYREVLEAILFKTDQEALNYEAIKRLDKINTALEKSNGDLLLEEAEFTYVKTRVESFRWRRWTRFTLGFIEDILHAAEVEVKVDETSLEAAG